jgi:hypothetical protein
VTAPRRLAPALLLLTLLASGCISPIISTVDINNAEKAIKIAADNQAEMKAPYEFFMAQELLRKAEEEWGYAEYSRSAAFADKAMSFAEKARAKAANDPWQQPSPESLKPREGAATTAVPAPPPPR